MPDGRKDQYDLRQERKKVGKAKKKSPKAYTTKQVADAFGFSATESDKKSTKRARRFSNRNKLESTRQDATRTGRKVYNQLKKQNKGLYSNTNRTYSPSENKRRSRMKKS